jgi:hypothetical protein
VLQNKRVLGCQDESMRTIGVVYLVVVPIRVRGISVQRHIWKICTNSIGRVRHLAVWDEDLEIKKASGHTMHDGQRVFGPYDTEYSSP